MVQANADKFVENQQIWHHCILQYQFLIMPTLQHSVFLDTARVTMAIVLCYLSEHNITTDWCWSKWLYMIGMFLLKQMQQNTNL